MAGLHCRHQRSKRRRTLMRTIPLTQGYTALVSDVDYARVVAAGPWYARIGKCTVYADHTYTKAGKRMLLSMHRFVMREYNPKREVDHRDHNGLHNWRRNLRKSNRIENTRNSSVRSNNTSGFKGVCWAKSRGKWQAVIVVKDHGTFLGYFSTAKADAIAYDKAARRLFGRFACTNF